MLREQLQALFDQIIADTIAWAPRVVALAVLIVVAVAFAWAGRRFIGVVLRRVRFDDLVGRSGIDEWMHRMGMQAPLGKILPRVGFYLILILFARSAADVVGLFAISDAITAVMRYVPNIVAALLILMIGSALAQFAGRAVAAAAEATGLQFASSLGTGVSGLIVFVLVMMAMAQLRIDTTMVQLVAGALLASVALGFGLSFGLGSKDVTRGILAGFYAKQQLQVGTQVEVGGTSGTLIGFTPTQLLIDAGDSVVSIPTSVLLTAGVKQKKA